MRSPGDDRFLPRFFGTVLPHLLSMLLFCLIYSINSVLVAWSSVLHTYLVHLQNTIICLPVPCSKNNLFVCHPRIGVIQLYNNLKIITAELMAYEKRI